MIETTCIDGLLIAHWETHGDARAFFRQTYQRLELEEALGRSVGLRQSNHARSAPAVLRGFHAEPWDKLIYVVRGRALTAIADVRPNSPTFGQVETFELGDGTERVRLFVSEGLANSHCTYGNQDVDYLYDVSDEYHPVDKRAIALGGRPGTYHLANAGRASWYDLAATVFECADNDVDLQPQPSKALDRPAPRPGWSVLETRHARLSGVPDLPHWRDGLERMLDALGEAGDHR